MRLYLLKQNVNNDYDTFDSCVVAAKSADEARLISPDKWPDSCSPAWAKPKDVKVKLIGTAGKGIEKGIILSSFNAG